MIPFAPASGGPATNTANVHTSHWHDTTSVPGPVDPHGCCADQPTATSIAADLRATVETDAAVRLADGLRG